MVIQQQLSVFCFQFNSHCQPRNRHSNNNVLTLTMQQLLMDEFTMQVVVVVAVVV